MFKNSNTIIIILVIIAIIGLSGCAKKTSNSTFGEKHISLDSIKVSNYTNGNYSEHNNTIYYVSGYIINKNPIDALNVKLKVITYDSNNDTVAINETPTLNPKSIPANGNSALYARFYDPEKRIVRFKIQIIDAKAEY